jgi:hypothetical protein
MIFKNQFVEEQFVEFTEFSLPDGQLDPSALGDITIYWYDNKNNAIHNCTRQEFIAFSQAIQDLKHPEPEEEE